MRSCAPLLSAAAGVPCDVILRPSAERGGCRATRCVPAPDLGARGFHAPRLFCEARNGGLPCIYAYPEMLFTPLPARGADSAA